MNEILQEAITATRAGKKKEAQLLLATNLKENPDDVQSWYLLSMLVDSKEKQAAYLGKALALNPNHPKAQAQMAKLTAVPAPTTTTAVPISDDPLDYLAQAEGGTLPDWLAQDAPALQLEKVGVRVSPEDVAQGTAVTTGVSASGQEVPNWLQQETNPAWVTQEQPTQVSPFAEPVAAKPSPKPKPAKTAKAQPTATKKTTKKRLRSKQEKKSQLNLALGALMVIMILVILALAYIAF